KLDELYVVMYQICFFFFQAEDGIRDRNVTGVQTCALPISAGDQFNYKIIFIPKIESFNIEYDLAHHPRVLQAVECLFEIGKRIGPVHDRPDFMLFDEFKHFMQLLCTRHGGAEKIVLPIEEFSQIEFHSVTGRCSERCQCPAAAQLADRFVEGCRTDTFNHNVNL